MAIKRLFEVSVRREHEQPSKVLLVLADDEHDLKSAVDLGDAVIVDVAEVDGRVPAAGPSRVIGWTRPGVPVLAVA